MQAHGHKQLHKSRRVTAARAVDVHAARAERPRHWKSGCIKMGASGRGSGRSEFQNTIRGPSEPCDPGPQLGAGGGGLPFRLLSEYVAPFRSVPYERTEMQAQRI